MKKGILFLSYLFLSFSINAQKTKSVDSLTQKATSTIKSDTVSVPLTDLPTTFNQTFLYKTRLDSVQQTVPLSYNSYVQQYIDIYSNRKSQFGKMLGLAKYYFPVFEKALNQYDIPTELKYLAVVESNLNPRAVSRVGATGIWQFMFATGKAYGLNINNFVDERKDPVRASYAAAAYFSDAYEELGDWLLAIAAYNCGISNVKRAIAKANSYDFWQIRPFLPRETRNYVPAFIAAVYVMNYAHKHQIVSQPSPFPFKTDIIQVNKYISLAALAKAIHYDENVLINLNPSFKKKVVNGTSGEGKSVVLPRINAIDYAAVYALLNPDASVKNPALLASLNNEASASAQTQKYMYHRVEKGEALKDIAEKYRIEVQDIKVWNLLPNLTIIPGQRLKIYKEAEKPSFSAKNKVNYITYKVKPGDTLFQIAKKFEGATVSSIKKDNGLNNRILKAGVILKIIKPDS